jgi:hypothetical protein
MDRGPDRLVSHEFIHTARRYGTIEVQAAQHTITAVALPGLLRA